MLRGVTEAVCACRPSHRCMCQVLMRGPEYRGKPCMHGTPGCGWLGLGSRAACHAVEADLLSLMGFGICGVKDGRQPVTVWEIRHFVPEDNRHSGETA